MNAAPLRGENFLVATFRAGGCTIWVPILASIILSLVLTLILNLVCGGVSF
jgi:hypothetical protein